MPLRCAGAAGVQEKIPPHCCGGIFESAIEESALGELGSPTGGLEAVLKFFDCRFSLIFRAFLPFQVSVVLFLNHKNRYFFNQKPSDVAHHLPPQKAPLVYCTSLLHRCP